MRITKLKKAKKALCDFYLINEDECYSEDDIILDVPLNIAEASLGCKKDIKMLTLNNS